MVKETFVFERVLVTRLIDKDGNVVSDWKETPENCGYGMSTSNFDYEDERLKNERHEIK